MSLCPAMGCYLWRQPATMSEAEYRMQCYGFCSILMFWGFYKCIKQKQSIRKGYNCFLKSSAHPYSGKKQPFTLLLHHLILQRCININSLLFRYPGVSIWTVKGQKGPQDEPEQADCSWTNVKSQN